MPRLTPILAAVLLASGCAYENRHEIQWSSESQIWRADASQVKVRSAQSRVFDTRDKTFVLEATVATFQDLGFQVTVLDEALGIVSGKKYLGLAKPAFLDPTYLLYDPESLLVFHKTYRTWGPFRHRSDLVRLTATVRPRNERQLIVRAAAQFYLRPIEDPAPYQEFFATLEQALFVGRQTAAGSDRPRR